MGLGKKREVRMHIREDFLAAYDAYADQLFRYCLIRIRDREMAKDVVQETFTSTWAYIASGKHIQHMRAFLYKTVHNRIIDTMRRKRFVSLDTMTEEDGYEPASEPEPTAAEREETKAALKLLDTLDDLYRTVIMMRFVEELTLGEIAEVLHVSENVVSVRIHRGLKQLREYAEREFTQ